jgi:hypothetical protein
MKAANKRRAPLALAPVDISAGAVMTAAPTVYELARFAERLAPRPALIVRADGREQQLGCWWDLRYPR